MPAKPKAPAPTEPPADPAVTLNKARAAFERYRQKAPRAEPAPAPAGWTIPVPGLPPGTPFPPAAVPPWGTPPMGPTTPPTSLPWPFPGNAAPVAAAGPLAASVGQMLQLGVAFATAAFAGGLQVLQGFTGSMSPAVGWGAPGPRGPHAAAGCGGGCGGTCSADCHCGDCDCDCDCDCGCAAPCRGTGCRPGVRNCSCGC
jgi:hypothetical protein